MKGKLEADENPLIAELDWNFDNVPDDELAACCLWEFARESKSFAVSSARKVEREESLRLDQLPNRTPNPDYEAFLESYWNCDEGYMAYYETIRNHGGPDSLPWLLIPAGLRQLLKKQVGVHELDGPLAPAMRRQLEALWKVNLKEWKSVRNQPGYDPREDGMAYEPSRSHMEEPGHAGEPHGETIAAFAIDFRKYNNKQICVALTDWLKANRPKDCPERSERGRKARDSRVALDRLGMMRLLHHFTLREMPKRCPEASKAFEGYEWYKERKRARMTFQKFFPFLPETERPLSWPTKGGHSK
jgi:hypothetical protein